LTNAGGIAGEKDFTMARVDIAKITPQFIGALFQQLSQATRNALGQMGTATDWARSIRSTFANESSLPAGFGRLSPSAQIEHAINAHLTAGRVSLAEISPEVKGASGRLAQLLSAGAVNWSHGEMIESLIDESTARQAGETRTGNQAQNTLSKGPDVNY